NQESRLPPGSDFRRWVWITIAPFVTTDSILRAAEARGGANALEKFAEFNISCVDKTASEYSDHLTETARAARAFAAKLREGKA
ncbi:hypothetical protein PO428_21945, partial [Escherichia coli]